ncbi:MAG: hypothetical protein JWM52_9 [Candidatus Saccharibacteria bacterium]|nr:hypothetical protein [Candidatus Saccharibacteria bacterium]
MSYTVARLKQPRDGGLEGLVNTINNGLNND